MAAIRKEVAVPAKEEMDQEDYQELYEDDDEEIKIYISGSSFKLKSEQVSSISNRL